VVDSGMQNDSLSENLQQMIQIALAESTQQRFSIQEYLELEAQAAHKHEFFNGKIKQMPGASYQHHVIATNLTTHIHNLIEAKNEPFIVCNSDMKIYLPRYRHFVYPDAVVVFERPVFYEQRKEILLNPILIVEVLSSSTGEYDKGPKFLKYKSLESFREYVLVEQDNPEVTRFYKQTENVWEEATVDDLEQTIHLKSLDIHLSLRRVYRNIEF
jgi:Uma2 family endonuclease